LDQDNTAAGDGDDAAGEVRMGKEEGNNGAEAAYNIQDKEDSARNREGAAVGTHSDPVGDAHVEVASGKDADSTVEDKVDDDAQDAAAVGGLLVPA
jgi:hypothetical protein